MIRPRLALVALTTAVIGFGAAAASAQAAPAMGGAELRVGLTFPQDANMAASVFGEVDVGYVWRPPLRVLVGLSRYVANIDREGGGDEGSFSATGLWASGRYDLFPRRDLAPYVRGGLTLQRVGADAFDAGVDALLQGMYVGAAAGVGARYLLDDRGRLSATAELRRTFMSNVGNTSLELGLRLQQRGFEAYVPEWSPLAGRGAEARPARIAAAPVTPAVTPADTAADRRLAELERAALEAERAVAALREAPPPVVAPVPGGAPADAAPPAPPAPPARPARDHAAVEAMFRQGLGRAAAAMGSVTRLEETDNEFTLILGGGIFASGSRSLAPRARNEIRVLATVLAGYPGHIILVEGHTDSVGDAAANQVLSQERAAAVRAALIAEGVDPLWVGSRGFGAQRPLASNQSAAGRAANRRVEIRASKQLCPVPPLPGGGGVLECQL